MRVPLLLLFTLMLNLNLVAQDTNSETSEVTTFYLIRHAEKDRSDAANKDPNLTNDGSIRAEKWAKILKNVKFDGIYSTNYNRTKQTASPLAVQNDLKISLYEPGHMNSEVFMRISKGKNILIVGHSNTTPQTANKLLGEDRFSQIDDSNNGNLYIITIIDGKTSAQLLTIN
ncbi:MAG: phosphoglycerate mutase [Bacteroidetes bacterium MedPE-SWsnd-G2]|nr:MAG: phosphoglycerate mutase [Bacteroidetes bacterium MedPE-SWsnd-G2]